MNGRYLNWALRVIGFCCSRPSLPPRRHGCVGATQAPAAIEIAPPFPSPGNSLPRQSGKPGYAYAVADIKRGRGVSQRVQQADPFTSYNLR